MQLKVCLSTIMLLGLATGQVLHAQSFTPTVSGTITVRVACNCQLIVERLNQPLHFMAFGKTKRDTKHLKINSNCAWNLRVVSNKRDNECNEAFDKAKDRDKNKKDNDKNEQRDNDDRRYQDDSSITYTLANFRGKGKLTSPGEKYIIGSSSQNLPSGIGELEFDVVFEIEGIDLKKSKCEEENIWVSFYVLPKE